MSSLAYLTKLAFDKQLYGVRNALSTCSTAALAMPINMSIGHCNLYVVDGISDVDGVSVIGAEGHGCGDRYIKPQ